MIPGFKRQRQADLSVFKVDLIYMASSRSDRVT